MHTAAHLCSAALLAWLALGANPLHAAAPGEDPVVLNKPVDYLRLPTAKQPTSSGLDTDRKSTRLNSSHLVISYAVFCLKKKKNTRPLYVSTIPKNSMSLSSYTE